VQNEQPTIVAEKNEYTRTFKLVVSALSCRVIEEKRKLGVDIEH